MKVILIGFMGVGKTTVGKRLAQKLNMNFIDMDDEIERIEGKSISKIFEKNNEQYFRNVETKVLEQLLKEENIIISTGGGIVTQDINIEILKNENKVVFLDATTKTIIKHLSNEIDKRPLLKNSPNIEETVNDLLEKRYEKYNNICSIKIDINEKNVEEVVSEILVYIS